MEQIRDYKRRIGAILQKGCRNGCHFLCEMFHPSQHAYEYTVDFEWKLNLVGIGHVDNHIKIVKQVGGRPMLQQVVHFGRVERNVYEVVIHHPPTRFAVPGPKRSAVANVDIGRVHENILFNVRQGLDIF